MRNKKNILFAFGIIFLVLLLQNIGAHFVCGEVLNSEDNFSADWFSVRAYFPSDENKVATCEVSPEGRKYCCDAEAIPPVGSWRVGDLVETKIVDKGLGYLAGPVSVITTGEGYDVMPPMNLHKVIRISSPSSKLIFSNNSDFFLNASFLVPYTSAKIELNTSNQTLCFNCTEFEGEISAEFGRNDFTIYASKGDDFFSEGRTINILKNYSFERTPTCLRCREDRVKSESLVEMKLDLNLSHAVFGLSLKEYVPVEWNIINVSGGVLERYSDSHNVIIFNVSGKEINLNYFVEAPRISFRPKEFVFRSSLEDVFLSEDEIRVYRWFWFFPKYDATFRIYFNESSVERRRVSSDRPYVIFPKGEIDTVAIYPEHSFDDAFFSLVRVKKDVDLFNGKSVRVYSFSSNINYKNIDKIYLKYRLSKIDSEEVYVLRDSWERVSLESYEENGIYRNYEGHLKPFKEIAFVEKKPKGGFFRFIFKLF